MAFKDGRMREGVKYKMLADTAYAAGKSPAEIEEILAAQKRGQRPARNRQRRDNCLRKDREPRKLEDLIASLADLVSGSADAGTPLILVKGLHLRKDSLRRLQCINLTMKIPNPLAPQKTAQIIADLGKWRLHQPDLTDIIEAIQIQQQNKLSFWDAMIICSAKNMGCKTIWTEDLNTDQSYAGIKAINPFL
jgi:hypothetical protein